MYFHSLMTGDMKQITEHTKSDHSDEDIPPSKLECIDQHTSLDIDLRSPFIRCDRKPVSRTSCHERKGVPAKGIPYIYIYIIDMS